METLESVLLIITTVGVVLLLALAIAVSLAAYNVIRQVRRATSNIEAVTSTVRSFTHRTAPLALSTILSLVARHIKGNKRKVKD